MSDERAGFEIDGVFYEVPLPSSFDLDEAKVFYETTGFVVEAIWLEDLGFADLMKREGFLTALVVIAYRRANQDASIDDIRARVGKVNRQQLFVSMVASMTAGLEEPDKGKGEGTTSVPNESSTSSSSESKTSEQRNSERSGELSTTSSVPRVVALGTTGTIESGTLSTSVPIRQAV